MRRRDVLLDPPPVDPLLPGAFRRHLTTLGKRVVNIEMGMTRLFDHVPRKNTGLAL
jgi:hypothetical protein